MYFDIILFGIEAAVGEKTLIYATQLVDAEVGVADSAHLLVAVAQREGTDNLLPFNIADLYILEVMQSSVVEKRRINLSYREALVILLSLAVAVGKEPEEVVEAVVEEVTVAAFFRSHRCFLQVTEHLQRVTVLINLVLGRQDIQFITALGIEDEEQTVDDVKAVVLYFCLECIIGIINAA